MEIHFGEAGRNVVEQIQDAFAGHVPRMADAEDRVVGDDVRTLQAAAHESQPRRQERGVVRLPRNADRSHSVLATHGDDDSENGRMHVHVVLRVDVIECEPGSRESLELRANLRFEIASRSRTEEKVYTRSHQIA